MKKSYSSGFTLIELLVVMGIIAIIGGVIMSILFSVVRGTNKTNKLIVVRQNGNYAISQMSKIIRDAKSLIDPAFCGPSGTSVSSIRVMGYDDQETRLDLSGFAIASLSAHPANLTDSSSVKVTDLRFSCSQQENSNTILINVNFTVTQVEDDPGSEESASLPFSTSIAFRNYQ